MSWDAQHYTSKVIENNTKKKEGVGVGKGVLKNVYDTSKVDQI